MDIAKVIRPDHPWTGKVVRIIKQDPHSSDPHRFVCELDRYDGTICSLSEERDLSRTDAQVDRLVAFDATGEFRKGLTLSEVSE